MTNDGGICVYMGSIDITRFLNYLWNVYRWWNIYIDIYLSLLAWTHENLFCSTTIDPTYILNQWEREEFFNFVILEIINMFYTIN